MKITIATGPIFPVPAVRGGAVQRLWEGLAREFAKQGHEVTIFAREFPGQAGEETVEGIRYVRRGGYAQSNSIKRDLLQCLLYALKVAPHVPAGDVVVTNDFWLPAVLPWMRPSAGKVIPCLQRFPKKQGALYGKSAALAAVSRAVADAVKQQSPSVADKVVVVPNAIDEVFLEETKGLKDQKTKRLEADGGPVRILYVGRIHPEKGLGLLASALRLLAAGDQRTKSPKDQESEQGGEQREDQKTAGGRRPETRDRSQVARQPTDKNLKDQETDWECVLVGPAKQSEGGGGEGFAGKLQRELEGLPVRFDPPVYDPSALVGVYDDADVFVYPSVAESGESFGIAPLEAMARGVAPVVSDLAVFRDYLEPGVNGLVFDHRAADAPQRLAETLRDLIRDKDLRLQMSARARQTAERFSPAAVAGRYLSLFERCLRAEK